LTNSQESKTEYDHSYQHLGYTSPTLQICNIQVVKKGSSEDRLKNETASNQQPEGRR
jgi:hypothetical protein